jgi:hypothetical protein
MDLLVMRAYNVRLVSGYSSSAEIPFSILDFIVLKVNRDCVLSPIVSQLFSKHLIKM